MSSRDTSYLEDVRVYGVQALDLVKDHDERSFAMDAATRLAVLHCLMLIGEAANQVSESTRMDLPAVPWSKVIGLRNVIVHHYRKVDLGEIWAIVARDLPPVVTAVEMYLRRFP